MESRLCIECGNDRDQERGSPQASAAAPEAGHLVIPLCDLRPLGGSSAPLPRTWNINADWVRVVSDYPVAVWLDDTRIGHDRTLTWEGEPAVSKDWEDAVPWSRPETPLHGGLDFTVRRRVKRISLDQVPLFNATEMLVKSIPGTVHVYYGAGGVENVGPGPYLHSSEEIIITPNPGSIYQTFIGPWRFRTHNKNNWTAAPRTGTPGSTQKIIPPEVELLDIAVQVPTNTPQVLQARLYYSDELGRESDWWQGGLDITILGIGNYRKQFANPLRLPTWAVDARGPAPLPGWFIDIQAGGVNQWDSLSIVLAWRFR